MKLRMHRSEKAPQWLAAAPAARNGWQRLAAASHGSLTPGNIVTLLGLGLVTAGFIAVLRGDYLAAFFLVAAGRLCDLLDGYAAELTRTKSPWGERLDAGIDKLETVAALPVLVVASVVDWRLAAAIAAPHAVIAATTGYGILRGRQPHPSLAGKLSMALAWAGLGLLLLVKALLEFRTDGPAVVVAVTAYGCLAAAFVLSCAAALGYVRGVRHG